MDKDDVIYTEYYLAMRKKEIILFVTKWMVLEDIMLNENKPDDYCMVSLMWNLGPGGEGNSQTLRNRCKFLAIR